MVSNFTNINKMNHLSSSPVFSGVRVIWSLVLCVCFVDRCLSFCTFSFDHCVFCSSSNYGFWLPLWYLQTLLSQTTVNISLEGSGEQPSVSCLTKQNAAWFDNRLTFFYESQNMKPCNSSGFTIVNSCLQFKVIMILPASVEVKDTPMPSPAVLTYTYNIEHM
jgi:hypothetical protein